MDDAPTGTFKPTSEHNHTGKTPRFIKLAVLLKSPRRGFFWKETTLSIDMMASITICDAGDNGETLHEHGIWIETTEEKVRFVMESSEDAKKVYNALTDALKGIETNIQNLVHIEVI